MSSEKVLNLHLLPAGHGDCAVIEYGEEAGTRNLVVVDGGVSATARTLRKFLNDRPDSNIELFVVSHIDSDHIAGAKKILKSKKVSSRFNDIWFNGFEPPQQNETLESYGFRQGDELSDILKSLPHNIGFDRRDVVVCDDSLPIKPLAGGGKITLLSPSTNVLEHLRGTWANWKVDQTNTPSSIDNALEKSFGILEVMGETPELDVDALAREPFIEDTSLANKSSIAFVFEYADVKILMAADAHADQLIRSGKRLSEEESYPVAAFKVPHHGSDRNISPELLCAFPTKRYVLSTNGEHHGHPTDIALARIVKHAPNCQMIFNYPNKASERWASYGRQTGILQIVVPSKAGDILTINLIHSSNCKPTAC